MRTVDKAPFYLFSCFCHPFLVSLYPFRSMTLLTKNWLTQYIQRRLPHIEDTPVIVRTFCSAGLRAYWPIDILSNCHSALTTPVCVFVVNISPLISHPVHPKFRTDVFFSGEMQTPWSQATATETAIWLVVRPKPTWGTTQKKMKKKKTFSNYGVHVRVPQNSVNLSANHLLRLLLLVLRAIDYSVIRLFDYSTIRLF